MHPPSPFYPTFTQDPSKPWIWALDVLNLCSYEGFTWQLAGQAARALLAWADQVTDRGVYETLVSVVDPRVQPGEPGWRVGELTLTKTRRPREVGVGAEERGGEEWDEKTKEAVKAIEGECKRPGVQ